MTRVAIVGTGDEALGLCSFFQNNNGECSGHSLVVTKKNLDSEMEGCTFHTTGVPLMNFYKAIAQADVVILAIPARALKVFVTDNYALLKTKILVDGTNSSVKKEDLREVIGATDVKWVKAFFDVGAIDGMVNKPYDKFKTASKMCSPYQDALNTVKDFAEESLGFDVKVVPYERYDDVAVHQNSLGNEWLIAGGYLFFWFCVFQFYNIMRHHVHGGYEWYILPLFTTNKIVAWTALHGMTSAMIPGAFQHWECVIET
jgi:predicted dinucleotide-binding enzyme